MKTIIKNNKYLINFKKQLYKFIVILVILGLLNGPELFTISHTLAFYNDTETSNGNIMGAGELDFILNEGGWTPPGGELDLEAGESVSRTITIAEDLTIGPSINFKYIITPVKTSGDNDFCSALRLEASLDGISQYEGPLFDFLSDATTFGPTADDWIFNISLPGGSLEFVDKSCNFDFIFSGWQIQFPNEGEGYNDVERSSNIIESPGAPFNPNVCPFEEGQGKKIIYFNNQHVLRSDTTLADANDGPIVEFIPRGTYDITLASYDEHLLKPTQIQPHEQWKLIMKNASGFDIAVTTPIRDIVDATEEQVIEKVEDDFSISEDVNLFTASHSAYGDHSSPNSLKALCAMFEGENLEDTTPLIAPPEGRTEDGLLVLYTFEENSGQVVQDVSGVGVPLNLLIPDLSKISRISGGLSVDSSTLISSLVPALKLTEGLKATNEITIEAWVKPSNISQGGPARIATLSKNHDLRNFTLAQDINKYTGRLRTPTTGVNGTTPPAPVFTPSGTASTSLQHVVYTRTSDIAKIYIDGVEVVSQTITGDFSNWDSSFRFGLANEFTMERTWLGELHLVAIYNRDLSPTEISQNFNVGADATGIVINEFLPNPNGSDNALMPGGEWVELYNISDGAVDVANWVLYDNDDSHELYITSSNTNTGGTIVGAHEFLVVYKNGDSDFILNNDADSVRLATGYPITSSIVIDSYTYTTEKPEGFSYARIPNGIGNFVDPIPTPGMPNDELIKEITPESLLVVVETEQQEEPIKIEEENPANISKGSDNEIKDEEIITTEDPIEESGGGEIINDTPQALEQEEVITEGTEIIEETITEEVKKEETIIETPVKNEEIILEEKIEEEVTVEEPTEPTVVEELVIETTTISE